MRPWQWFSVDGVMPGWLDEVAAAVGAISAELGWVHTDAAAWETSAVSAIPGGFFRSWLDEPELHAVRERLERLGFTTEGDVPPPSGQSISPDPGLLSSVGQSWKPWRPSGRIWPVAEGVERPYPLRQFDALDPQRDISIDIEWSPNPLPQFEFREAGVLDVETRYLVLARQSRARAGLCTFETSTKLMHSIFDDPRAATNLARRLPIRGALVVPI